MIEITGGAVADRAVSDVAWPTAERMARLLLAHYAAHVGPIADLAAELGINGAAEALDEPHGLPPAELQRLYGRAVSRLALHASAAEGRPQLRSSDWRVILYGLDGGRTLREAILRTSDCFEAVDGRCGLMTLSVRGEVAELRFDTLRRRRDAINCLVDLNGIPQMHSQLSWLIGTTIPVLEFALDYPAEVYVSLSLPPLPFPLRLASGWSGIVFPAVYLDYPLIRGGSDRESGSIPASLLFLGGEELAEPSVASRARAFALQALRETQRLPAFEDLAIRFGCSVATLRRKLAREGSTYRDIRSSCRREVALDLLRRTTLTVEDIAAQLDFCDSDAFRSAFDEWMNDTPTGYRRRMHMPASRH